VIPVLMPGCASPPTGFLELLTWVDLRELASFTSAKALMPSELRFAASRLRLLSFAP
jgi:hypothetical protein